MGAVVSSAPTRLRVSVAGGTGWAGQAIVRAILQEPDLALVGVVARRSQGRRLREVLGGVECDLTVSGSVVDALKAEPADVLIDYTHPDVVRSHVEHALAAGTSCVVGTSGLDDAAYDAIARRALDCGRGVLAAGNFSMAAVLQQQFAVAAAKFFRQWEVFDYAHDRKPDAPSGMTRELAYRLREARSRHEGSVTHDEGKSPARGLSLNGTRVHSLRLPGFVIGAEIVFGTADERLSIRYDAGSAADPYVDGTLRAVRAVTRFVGLRRGLASILDPEVLDVPQLPVGPSARKPT
jgi:4-hydroxy-tetrahydrodipicolinate reductase